MIAILFLFAGFFSFGLYQVALDYYKMPTSKAVKAIVLIDRRERKKTRNFEIILNEISMKLGKHIKVSPYRKRRLSGLLKAAQMKISPETYLARAWVKALLTLTFIIPTLILIPFLFPLVLFLAIAVYFRENNRVEEEVKKRREEIEYELPRFVATLTQEFKASRNVLHILEVYKNNTTKGFRRELEITIADMRSGSYEAALTRWEARINSPKLSEVIRGIIGVLRGDDGIVYFQMLTHDLKLSEFQRLKSIAMKRPGKIRKYSFAMLFCFMLMYLSVMFIQILESFTKLF